VHSETFTPETLQTLNKDFEQGAPQDVLRWAAETFGDQLAVVTSFQPTGIVTLHMLSEIAPRTPVLTLDTGLLFPETYVLMDTLEAQLSLNLIRVRPVQTVSEQAAAYGDSLWARNPDQCCNLRKVVPLDQALVGYNAWITGLRRDQSDGRQSTPIVSWDKRYQRVKLCPFAAWTEDMIWTYIEAYELPYNALHDQHYLSIGCVPCTQPVNPDETDKRAGRWAGRGKTECGIHLAPTDVKTNFDQLTNSSSSSGALN
jgi:phosphoadenosine phosphosulfate reductase